jgi:hypothetical protein
MSVLVSGLIWERSQHKGSDLLVLLAIADNAHDNGRAWPSYPYLAAKTRLGERAVHIAVKRLLAGDELVIERKGGGHLSNRYRINVDVLRKNDPRKVFGAGVNEGSGEPSIEEVSSRRLRRVK